MIDILLATYNGSRYIEEQIDSILCQTFSDWHLIIHDDGSSDNTLDIVKRYVAAHPGKIFLVEDGIKTGGAKNNFFHLMKFSTSDYVMFCDQDDVWENDKISTAIENLRTFEGVPAMYCARTNLVDDRLRHIGYGKNPEKKPALEYALVHNIATGCTIALNRAGYNLIMRKRPDLNNVLMHDYWVYLVVSAFGVVIFDKDSKIKYRQHANNFYGASNGFSLWFSRLKRFIKKNEITLSMQAKEFFDLYGDEISASNKVLYSRFINACCSDCIIKRFYYSIGLFYDCGSRIDNFAAFISIVTGRHRTNFVNVR
ncbi:glycosyltransferase family 2 protein [Ectopseudomonas oleovorans]|uniref:glycosyltransferase family 2 protein n=1 Tax=Ectopseudomonas oleovorans TaxID=301 RepID=UPI00163B32E5|nr:glycosyltransferase family 2 protein [Pseudomonas oleovorans]